MREESEVFTALTILCRLALHCAYQRRLTERMDAIAAL
jgi:hypothetical protein